MRRIVPIAAILAVVLAVGVLATAQLSPEWRSDIDAEPSASLFSREILVPERLTTSVAVAASVVVSTPDANSGEDVAVEDDDPPPLKLERFDPKPLTAADLPPASLLAFGGRIMKMGALFGRNWTPGRSAYKSLVEREASAFGIPEAFVDAVMAVESGYNPGAVGLDGEVGLMQVMLPTARMMGFSGSSVDLSAPEVNIHYGVKYLARAWQLASGDLCTAAMKYRAGHGETRFSFLSVDYCLRICNHLSARGVVVTGAVPQATFGGRRTTGAARARMGSGGRAVDFVAINARLRDISERRVLRN